MPYITPDRRVELDKGQAPATAGDLNYAISMLVDHFVVGKGESYDALNTVVGVLECAKQEYYRRVVARYEDKKKQETGDVYHP